MPSDLPAEYPRSNNPRSPSMIERRLASLAMPPAIYGYEDQPQYGGNSHSARHSNNSSLYSGSPYGSLTDNHHTDEQSDADVSTQAAASGASGALPTTHTSHPQYSRQQQQSQYIPQQYSSPGPVILPSPSSTVYADLPSPVVSVAAVRNTAETPVPPSRNVSLTRSHHLSYLNRRPTQVGGAPPAYDPKDTDIQKDSKLAPPAVSNASASGSSGYANDRPTSDTVYYATDAYGGF